MPLLEVKGYTKSFGGLKAVNEVSFGVEEGKIKAVIGPNGAGKTTLFNLISGFIPLDDGEAYFNGKPIHGSRSYQIARKGISRTFQHIRLFHGMTVLENVMVGRHIRSRGGFIAGMLHLPYSRREERTIRDKAMEALEFMGVSDIADSEATSLSFGQQRAVEFARALALEPKLLLLDEPAAGLNMHDTSTLAELILKIRDQGVTVLIVEHDMSLVMKISDEILVLNYGSTIADDVPLAVQKNEEVVRIYLGEDDA